MPIPKLSAIGGCSPLAARGTLIFGTRLRGERDEARAYRREADILPVPATTVCGRPPAAALQENSYLISDKGKHGWSLVLPLRRQCE